MLCAFGLLPQCKLDGARIASRRGWDVIRMTSEQAPYTALDFPDVRETPLYGLVGQWWILRHDRFAAHDDSVIVVKFDPLDAAFKNRIHARHAGTKEIQDDGFVRRNEVVWIADEKPVGPHPLERWEIPLEH